MKRLLVYLFIILGLGLNSITNSPATPQLKNSIENNLFGERFFCIRSDNNRYIHYSHGIYPGKNNKPRDCRRDGYFIVYENSNKKLFKKLLTIYINYHGTFQPIKITKRTYTKIINNPDINIFKEETQITKAEPDQTKSAEVYWDAVIKNNSYNKKFVALKQSTKEKAINLVTNKCVNWLRQRGEMYQGKQYTFCTAHLKISKHKTQIAKAEPSQTKSAEVYWDAEIKDNSYNKRFVALKQSTKEKAINLAINECYAWMRQSGQDMRNKFKICSTKVKVTKHKNQITKAEPTIIPKKKVKVAKVDDSTQEEFKPKKTNQDNEAPVIQIAEAITVNDTDYEFEGTVTDKSKQIFIEVDGRLVDVKKGKFTVKGYSPVDKEISIQAIDGYGNRSKTKIVKLIIDIKDTDIAEKLEPLNPSKIRAKVSKNRVALIIGIENYIEAPKANYANLDAKYFFDYARKGFGIKKQNINLLVDENATFVKTSKALTLWLKTKIKADQTDLVVFFAGHGLASNDGKELYLLPQDSDPNLLDITALSRTKLFQTIIDLKPKSVTMFLDTCYSGVSRDEQMLLASARPIRIVADEQEGIPDNFTIFTASQVEQISSGLKEANHGIFSYYLMKGLEGKADSNQDKKITNGELLAYMDENVSQKAAELGRPQNPSLAGDPDKVLMSYR